MYKNKPLQQNVRDISEDIHLVCLGGYFTNNFLKSLIRFSIGQKLMMIWSISQSLQHKQSKVLLTVPTGNNATSL